MSIVFIVPIFAFADDSIKVLMLDSPKDPQPSEQAQKVESLNGKVFFNNQSYSGSFEIMKDENGLYIVNNISFEKYIEGVVASEVGKSWLTEALKAQAVISRTYALYNKNLQLEKNYHLTSSVLHQAYKGENTDPLIAQAVESTKGEILTYQGKPANAFYHATCEGKTELPEEVWTESYPYLRSVDCNGKNTPYEKWTKEFTLEQIRDSLGIPGFIGMTISAYTATGRVKTLTMQISKANENYPLSPPSDKGGHVDTSEMEIKATELRMKLGYKELPSTDFTLSVTDGMVVFNGRGYGHGVGLSQWGSLEMAREGKNYRDILAHYYPGTEIRKNEELHSKKQIDTQAQRDKGTQREK